VTELTPSGHRVFHGPKCWAAALLAGLALGAGFAFLLPSPAPLDAGPPDVQPFLALPFALLLLAIAVMPFLNQRFWEHHYPDFAFLLGGATVAYYVVGLRGYAFDGHAYGPARMLEVGREYFQFIALIGSLYVVTGGIHIDVRGRGTPRVNTVLLAVGAVVANVFGTTGAAALLIRPFLRINKHRIRPFHVVLFIFIVANCAGCLTPIGDPPLFIGYLKNVSFTWTLVHCLPAWAVAVGLLLVIFFILDTRAMKEHQAAGAAREPASERTTVAISGWLNFVFLGVVLFGVFFDRQVFFRLTGQEPPVPLGACLQIAAALAAYKLSQPENLRANEFTFNPIKEVALLFAGIFATMVPALDYLANHAAGLGVTTPTSFYWATGTLSSFLDNAPTYYNFFSAAHGLAGLEPGRQTEAWLALPAVGPAGASAAKILLAVSLGSVFFGANTYIGNGPNFMVKAISEAAGVPMPTFFGYLFKYTLPIMLPILAVVWVLFVSGWVF
jgi:Na+/H+ antiporter NhaD/arsenite permease-like protein